MKGMIESQNSAVAKDSDYAVCCTFSTCSFDAYPYREFSLFLNWARHEGQKAPRGENTQGERKGITSFSRYFGSSTSTNLTETILVYGQNLAQI